LHWCLLWVLLKKQEKRIGFVKEKYDGTQTYQIRGYSTQLQYLWKLNLLKSLHTFIFLLHELQHDFTRDCYTTLCQNYILMVKQAVQEWLNYPSPSTPKQVNIEFLRIVSPRPRRAKRYSSFNMWMGINPEERCNILFSQMIIPIYKLIKFCQKIITQDRR